MNTLGNRRSLVVGAFVVLLAPYPVQIVQSGDWLAMVHEFQRMTRLIPLDGRPHREGIEPTFYGDSVGHWEDGTLVIETQNFVR